MPEMLFNPEEEQNERNIQARKMLDMLFKYNNLHRSIEAKKLWSMEQYEKLDYDLKKQLASAGKRGRALSEFIQKYMETNKIESQQATEYYRLYSVPKNSNISPEEFNFIARYANTVIEMHQVLVSTPYVHEEGGESETYEFNDSDLGVTLGPNGRHDDEVEMLI